MNKEIQDLKNKYAFLDLHLIDFFGKLKTISLPTSYIDENVIKQGIGFDASNLNYSEVTKSDLVIIPEMATLKSNPFSDLPCATAFGNIGHFPSENSAPEIFPFDPRWMVRQAALHLKEKGYAYQLMVLPELEFYLFSQQDYSLASDDNFIQISYDEAIVNQSKGYHSSSPFDAFPDVRMHMVQELENAGIPVKYHHHEVGLPGQCEIELDFLPLEKAADAIIMGKHIVRNVAHEFQLVANFMPKPMYGLPGSGMHLHMYLVNDKGESLFFDENNKYRLSKQGMYFMGGILRHLGAIMAFSNATTNSYKRLISGYEAPQDKSFAKSSRNAAIRIPAYTRLEETRFEYRTADAACNPYYTLIALLLAGMDGIEHKIDPENPEQIKINEDIPRNLFDALDALKHDHQFLMPLIGESFILEWIRKKAKEAELPNNYPNPAEFDIYSNY